MFVIFKDKINQNQFNTYNTCSTCVDTATKCTGCKINSQRKLSNNECICNNHYYHVNLLWDCQQCSIYCYNCSGATRTECLDCQSIQNRELKSIVNYKVSSKLGQIGIQVVNVWLDILRIHQILLFAHNVIINVKLAV